MNYCKTNECCAAKPALTERALLNDQTAREIQSLFKLLSNVTRLRMLHALAIHKELNVGALSEKIGMKPQAVSNQLQKLTDRRILSQRRQGLNIYYSIADSCLNGLLEQGLCLIEDSKKNFAMENSECL